MSGFGSAGAAGPDHPAGDGRQATERVRPMWQRAPGVYARLFVICAVLFGTVEGLLRRSTVGGVTSGLVFGVC